MTHANHIIYMPKEATMSITDFSDIPSELTQTEGHTPEQIAEFKRKAASLGEARKQMKRLTDMANIHMSSPDYELQFIIKPKSRAVIDMRFWQVQLQAIRIAARDHESSKIAWVGLLKQACSELKYPETVIPSSPYTKISVANQKIVRNLLKDMGITGTTKDQRRNGSSLTKVFRLHHAEALLDGAVEHTFSHDGNTLVAYGQAITVNSAGEYRIGSSTNRIKVARSSVNKVVGLFNYMKEREQ